jgi:peptidoglycan/xylan/chitin deacetylase (PgdA/CDA1 family)
VHLSRFHEEDLELCGGSSKPLERIVDQQSSITYLMYHEIAVPGRALSRDFSGHVAYAVPETEIRSQLHHLREHGWQGISVTEALSRRNTHRNVVLTFDDGSETDFLAAAPLLKEMNFKATFYVVVGWLGRTGYLSRNQLRELLAQGFEVGCHSMNHRYLSDLSDDGLCVEIAEAKTRLEQILGIRLDHFSCPGGFWDRRVARLAEQSGYRSVVTSRTGINTGKTDPYRLARISVMKGTSLTCFDRICRGQGLFARRAKEAILSVPKSLLGADSYVRFHSVLHGN